LAASRVHPAPVRRMQAWGPEGYAGLDFARRRLTLIQPAEALRHGRIDSRRLDAATLASVRAGLFGEDLEVQERDCDRGDQLTRELQEFVECVRTGRAPRVDGVAGRNALALAGRVLASLRAHAWNGNAGGPVGPNVWPAPLGMLFVPEGMP